MASLSSADTADISSSVNTPSMWRNPASARKWPISSGGSSSAKARPKSSGAPVTITEVDEAGLVDLTPVEQEAQKWLPGDEGLDRAAADLGAPGQLQAEGRRHVLDQLGETLTVQGDDEPVAAAAPHFEASVVRGQCHLLPVDVEGERRELEPGRGDAGLRTTLVEQGRDPLLQELVRVHEVDVTVEAGSEVDGRQGGTSRGSARAPVRLIYELARPFSSVPGLPEPPDP